MNGELLSDSLIPFGEVPCHFLCISVVSEYLLGLLAGVLRREEEGYLLSNDSLDSWFNDSLEEDCKDS